MFMPYDFKKAEEKFRDIFATIFTQPKGKQKFYCLEMFPYPSGRLHMGHVRNYTIGDCMARYKRMLGYKVLYPMGYDSFGLPAENAAIQHNIHPKEWTEKCIEEVKQQQKAMGFSYDWSREIATHKPEYYKWNQYFFIKLFEKGLAYRKKAPANYCPSCRTVLANEQVINGCCWRCKNKVEIKQLEQWFFKITNYAEELLEDLEKIDWPERIKEMQRNWIGKSEGTIVKFKVENTNDELEVFTTRVDTIYGVRFLAIAPEHEKLLELCSEDKKEEVKKFIDKVLIEERFERTKEKAREGIFIGKYAIHPLTNERIPIYTANFVLPDYGTGIVMGVPANDQRDFEFAKANGLSIKYTVVPFIIKVRQKGKVQLEQLIKINKLGSCDVFQENDIIYLRFGINEREKMLKLLSEKGIEWEEVNLYDSSEINKKISEELGKAFEGYGVLVDSESESESFNGLDSYEAIKAITKELEKRGKGRKAVEYKMRDWLISRQRYWGTPIPVVYCEKCGIVPVPIRELPIKLPEKVEFGFGNPLETNKEWVHTKCPKCNSNARRETDTMDTFVDSSWYFLRFIDNKNDKEPFDVSKIKEWMPVDLYIGGAEHATMHLIYARFFTKVLRDLGFLDFDEPFLKLVNQGIVTLGGAAMSKSLGNIVDPSSVIPKYGVDALRMFILFKAMPDKDLEWSDEIDSIKRFLDKIADLVEFFKENRQKNQNKNQNQNQNQNQKDQNQKNKFLKNEYILAKINYFIKEYSKEISNMQFPYAIIHLMDFVKTLNRNKEKISADIFELCLNNLALLLNPITPYLSEMIYSELGNKGYASLADWPIPNENLIKPEFLAEDDYISNIISDINDIKKMAKKEPEKIVLIIADDWKFELFELIKECKTLNEAIAKIKASEYSSKLEDVIKLLPKFIGKLDFVLDADKEIKIIIRNKEELEKELKAKLVVLHEKEAIEYIKYKEKAKRAMPFKPVIIFE